MLPSVGKVEEQGIARWEVAVGEERTSVLYQPGEGKAERGVFMLAHGAGGHMEHRNLAREAAVFRPLGLGVVRFNFLYRAAGRKYPDKMPLLMECYTPVIASVRERVVPRRLFLGGHSMGGRVATMMAADGFPCDGLILLAYPLHPPGKTDLLRAEHLARIRVPVLCFNGTRDDFARRDLMEAVVANLPRTWTQHWLEGADHSFRVPKKSRRSDADVFAEIASAARAWILTHTASSK
jgi:hypothetical protein